MILFKKADELRSYCEAKKKQGLSTGFAPTMGALHEGHISLIKACREKTDITISSIFVNPTQFNDPKDFKQYPHTIEKDIYLLEGAGCDLLFIPSVEEMYPNGIQSTQHYNLGVLETLLEGKFRPGHFQGVCQVVHRLLEIVDPTMLFLGQKDYQQCMVINELIRLTGLQTELSICPTQREADGLAMSSRNMRLSETERKQAVRIYETLSFIKQEIKPGNLLPLQEKAAQFLNDQGFKVDYVAIANQHTLEPVTEWNGHDSLVVLIAAFLHEVRLIDNILIDF